MCSMHTARILDDFKKSLLNIAVLGDFEAFINEVSTFKETAVPWNKIYHKKSGDTVVHLAAACGCIEILK